MSHDNTEEKQCRICLDGPDPELGRLIRPCLCRGSISYVHIKCLQRWRNSSETAFFACPQCHYRYHFSRTRVVGIATNPVIVAAISTVVFTVLVIGCSFVTTYFFGAMDDYDTSVGGGYFYISFWPYDTVRDVIRAAIRILRDQEGIFDDGLFDQRYTRSSTRSSPPGLLMRLVQRFLLGLPIVAAGSLIQLLMSVPLPLSWIARWRARQSRSSNRDVATLIIVFLIIMGALRALYKVYEFTEKLTKRLLLRAEDAILEVST